MPFVSEILRSLSPLGWTVLELGLFGLVCLFVGSASQAWRVSYLRTNLDIWTRAAKRHQGAVAALEAERGRAAPSAWEWNGDELGWSRDYAAQRIRLFVVPVSEADRAMGWKWEASELDAEGALLDGEVIFDGAVEGGGALDNIRAAEVAMALRPESAGWNTRYVDTVVRTAR